MKTLNSLLILCTVHAGYADLFSPRRDLPFIKLAKYDGHDAEEHYVITEDGYILCIHRIPPHKDCTETKGVGLFGHGLYLSSDDCIIPGPNLAHCYIYSNNCHDMWAPNFRGNFYSRNHTSLNPDKDPKFWDFTIDQMALYDLPAIINYILKITNSSQIWYIGHSQAVAILIILCSKVPEYNAKIKVGIGLSATVFLEHSKFFILQLQGATSPLLTHAHGLLTQEIFPRGGFIQIVAKLLCGLTKLSYPICSVLVFALFGYDEFQITSEVFPAIVGHTPSGTSVKNYNRWGEIALKGFCEYDHDEKQNLAEYGQKEPLKYDLSKVTMKWVMIASKNDNVADLEDVQKLVTELNAVICVISNEKFTHLDFIYAKEIYKYIAPIVLSLLETGNYVCT